MGVAAYALVQIFNIYLFPALRRLIPIRIPELVSLGITYGIAFSGIYMLFATLLWNRMWMPSLIVSVPDLTGHWEGYIQTSFEGEIDKTHLVSDGGSEAEYQEMGATLDIRQTWWKIAISFETGRSSSYSTSARFQMEQTLQPRLSYLFQNEGPSPHKQSESEGRYTGASEFKLQENADEAAVLEGVYYTGPEREHTMGPSQETKTNYGFAKFIRVNDDPKK